MCIMFIEEGNAFVNRNVDTILGTIVEGTEVYLQWYLYPGTGDFYPCEANDPRASQVEILLIDQVAHEVGGWKKGNGEPIMDKQVFPAIHIRLPIEFITPRS